MQMILLPGSIEVEAVGDDCLARWWHRPWNDFYHQNHFQDNDLRILRRLSWLWWLRWWDCEATDDVKCLMMMMTRLWWFLWLWYDVNWLESSSLWFYENAPFQHFWNQSFRLPCNKPGKRNISFVAISHDKSGDRLIRPRAVLDLAKLTGTRSIWVLDFSIGQFECKMCQK